MNDNYQDGSNVTVTQIRRNPVEAARIPSRFVGGLPENSYVERRADGSVYVIEIPPERFVTGADGKPRPLIQPDRFETRIDSREDEDYVRRGGTLWYAQYLTK